MAHSGRSAGMTYDSEESFRRRYMDVSSEPVTSLSSLGDALSSAIKFEEIRSQMQRLVDARKSDREIALKLQITLKDAQNFRTKLKKSDARRAEAPEPVEKPIVATVHNREISLEEYLADPRGEIIIIGWPSYYLILRFVAKELTAVRHVKDQSLGILISPDDLYPLLEKALTRIYPRHVIEKMLAKNVNPVEVVTDKEDARSLRTGKGNRIRMCHIVIHEELIKTFQNRKDH